MSAQKTLNTMTYPFLFLGINTSSATAKDLCRLHFDLPLARAVAVDVFFLASGYFLLRIFHLMKLFSFAALAFQLIFNMLKNKRYQRTPRHPRPAHQVVFIVLKLQSIHFYLPTIWLLLLYLLGFLPCQWLISNLSDQGFWLYRLSSLVLVLPFILESKAACPHKRASVCSHWHCWSQLNNCFLGKQLSRML